VYDYWSFFCYLFLFGGCVEEVDCFLVAACMYEADALFGYGEHGAPYAGWLDFAEFVNDW